LSLVIDDLDGATAERAGALAASMSLSASRPRCVESFAMSSGLRSVRLEFRRVEEVIGGRGGLGALMHGRGDLV